MSQYPKMLLNQNRLHLYLKLFLNLKMCVCVPIPATPSNDIPPKPVPDASGKAKTDVPLRRSNRIRRPPKRLDL
ncbi:hypothetical protein TNCV_386191 [Trichonephila clavipes]|nr:hypothetical protein TNCV_386191 [Trichonephila clavipes]